MRHDNYYRGVRNAWSAHPSWRNKYKPKKDEGSPAWRRAQKRV